MTNQEKIVSIYVGDITSYLGQTPYESFEKRLPTRIKFWLNGSVASIKKPQTKKNSLIQLIERTPVEELDSLVTKAEQLLTKSSFTQLVKYVSREKGKKMEEKLDDIGIREVLLRNDIIKLDGIRYRWSVRCDGLLNNIVTEVKTRKRSCSSVYYPNEYTQCQIYMELSNVDKCRFIEFSQESYIIGYNRREKILHRSKKTFDTILTKTIEMIRTEIHPKLSELWDNDFTE